MYARMQAALRSMEDTLARARAAELRDSVHTRTSTVYAPVVRDQTDESVPVVTP